MSAMARLGSHRFIGTRDTMRVYDIEDLDEKATFEFRLTSDDLIDQNLIQTFGPDTLPEARNRGFRPI